MATKLISNNTTDTERLTSGTANLILQVFNVTDSFELDSVKLYLRNGNGMQITVYCNLYGWVDSHTFNTPTLLSSQTMPATTTDWVTFDFSGYAQTLSSGEYVLKIYCSSGVWVQESSTNQYGSGDQSVWVRQETSWPYSQTQYASADAGFEIWGDAAPEKPINPTPSHTTIDIRKSLLQLSWEDGGGADTFDVYFGPTGSMALLFSGQAGVTYDISTYGLLYNQEYSWRIDAENASGVTTGDTWTFTIEVFDPPTPTGAGDGGGGGGGASPNLMQTIRRVVAAADNKLWYEDL